MNLITVSVPSCYHADSTNLQQIDTATIYTPKGEAGMRFLMSIDML